PDLSAVLQEIVNRPGWVGGNAVVLIITGTGKRVAKAYDEDHAGAPLLHVEYSTSSGSGTTPPTITSFTPTSGPVGTAVPLPGTNFVPGATQVALNGTPASVNGATAPQLNTRARRGATTGRIRLTSATGSSAS